MSLLLLVDEDLESRHLLRLLKSARHDVRTATEEGLDARPDALVLQRAQDSNRALLTRNAKHFRELHDSGAKHSGILVVYRERNPSKSMSHADVLRALSNLQRAGLDLTGQFVSLNSWAHK
ncbi:MAG: DUF5615 family PIN-like protein [Armatimonadetes bacterium]|nr:DUF5615 family PIN-like protein [Armatimonadota bacterium]